MTSSEAKSAGSSGSSSDIQKNRQAIKAGGLSAWYCSSRWLMAHHDPFSNISTTSAHMCLADLHGEGENLLALVDFKRHNRLVTKAGQPPYDCRIRVYRGQQLIYNHFLDDLPSSMVVVSVRPTEYKSSVKSSTRSQTIQTFLTVTINDDIYFYNKLKPSHKLSLEDNDDIMASLAKSEFEAWQMVKQNRVDVETLRELLQGLSTELGNNQLTSHSQNFLALKTSDERKSYLLSWKMKKLGGLGENIMNMDTICCAASRDRSLVQSDNWTRGQPNSFGSGFQDNDPKHDSILGSQRDGLVIGTEDRHLIIYELLSTRTQLEYHHRLPSSPDHILVEPYRPAHSFDLKTSSNKTNNYRIIVSCRNRRIYCLDYKRSTEASLKQKANLKELLTLRCNVVQMCWTSAEEDKAHGVNGPFFAVACLNRRVYCFSSLNGHCKWSITLESSVTSIINISTTMLGSQDISLIGIATEANRIDFYTSSSGRIVDSIYFSNDYCQAMTFGRFGREDNCLVVTTNLGHLLIFILKRTAKFSHGQCLSSAASYASDAISKIGINSRSDVEKQANSSTQSKLNLNESVNLPSPFSLTVSPLVGNEGSGLDQSLAPDHDCERSLPKGNIDAFLKEPRLQIPAKSRDFVDNIVYQSRHSTGKYRHIPLIGGVSFLSAFCFY